jgi:lipopolysaccharide biosynthesis glycosyltransferase
MPGSEDVPIVFACDGRFVHHTVVAMHSLLAHRAKGEFVRIHVLGSSLTPRHLEKLRAVGQCYANCQVTAENVDLSVLAGCYCGLWTQHGTIHTSGTLLRLLIPNLFLAERKALWLDSDILVLDSLRELRETDVEDHYLAAVKDDVAVRCNFAERIGIPESQVYFSSGVMVMNLRKMRHDLFPQRSLGLLQAPDAPAKFCFPDQDVLNLLAKGIVKLLPLHWNYYAWLPDPAPGEASIIHYAGKTKPEKRPFSAKALQVCYWQFEKSLCRGRWQRLLLFGRRCFCSIKWHFSDRWQALVHGIRRARRRR